MENKNIVAVKIESRLLPRIGIREWGLPSCITPGQIWRSEQNGTISCMVVRSTHHVSIETRPLKVIDVGEMSWMPDHWRRALWAYVQEWPLSGCQFGPFLSITNVERCNLIRKLGEQLVKSDDIGCRSIADSIGDLASISYELSDPTPPSHQQIS